jgi:predicted O-methyltransferase YrrM
VAQSVKKKKKSAPRKVHHGGARRSSVRPITNDSYHLASQPPAPVSGHSAALLADTRLRWSLGDWTALTSLPLESIEHSPDRAEVALLFSCAHLQLNDKAAARRQLAAAARWDCPPELILRALSSVLEDTMATYYRRKGDMEKAMLHLTASAQAFAGNSAPLAAQARMALATIHDDAAKDACHEASPGLPSRLETKAACHAAKLMPLGAGKYDLSHLEQFQDQYVIGPIQDDEALFLYSVIRGMRISTVLELGGLEGYSARNFLKALGPDGVLFTCDLHPVQSQAAHHRVITKNCSTLTSEDLLGKVVELVFFDCHEYEAQMACFTTLWDQGSINENTLLVLHDTNVHPHRHVEWAYRVPEGFIHQPVERRMVNDFVGMGYHALSLHTANEKHSPTFPFRHGITVMQKWKKLSL